MMAIAGFSIAAIGLAVGYDYYSVLPPDTKATYVGRQSCVECHREEAAAYENSHHDLAMDLATEASVIGNFNDATFEHHGIVSRMFRDGSRYMIHTEGPEGEMRDFEVKYVFGVDPLQQYMVEFDRDETTPDDAVARVQVLRISWDTARKQWFYLEPPDVPEKLDPHDDLHWTGIAQRWNTMCADCHSTDLKKNFDPETTKYSTTFSEIDVSCEACHGPGSTHVELARSKSLFWDRNLGYGLAQLKGDDSTRQIEACAPCHSRRGLIAEGFQAGDSFCDFYDPSPLSENLYHADGQILDEVYVYGSFTQSKMYHKGIRCTDCHDPHSLKLKAPGNQVCTSCHQHPAGKYDTPSHHKHAPGTAGASCVECHMPERTYMAVDPRRDHSIRIPRPDLSVSLGTPNACTGCHLNIEAVDAEKRPGLREYADWQLLAAAGDEQVNAEIERANRWSDEACDKWYGDERHKDPHYAETLARVRGAAGSMRGTAGGADELASMARQTELAPAIARATALDELAMASGALAERAAAGEPSGLVVSIAAARESLDDPSPMVRAAAIRVLAGEAYGRDGANKLAKILAEKLTDPSRLVRLSAARVLVSTGAFQGLGGTAKTNFGDAIAEIRDGLKATSDRAGSHMDWAMISESMGNIGDAIEAYKTAMRVEPRMTGPRSNLAGLLDNVISAQQANGQIDAAQAERTRDSIRSLRAQELVFLERDARLAPTLAPVQYRLGLAYYLAGRIEDAIEKVQLAVDLEPNNEEFKTALGLLLKKRP